MVGDDQEERLRAAGAAADESHRLVGKHVGLVAAVGAARRAVVVQAPVPVVHDPVEKPRELGEAAAIGVVAAVVQAAVPLADVAGAVAGGGEQVAERPFTQGDAVQAAVGLHAEGAHAVMVAAGEQGGARRSADRGAAVVLRAAHARGGQTVAVRGRQDGVAVATQVAVPKIVRHDDDDVGTELRTPVNPCAADRPRGISPSPRSAHLRSSGLRYRIGSFLYDSAGATR